jgi:glycosyltransferase involved in cell wall biosynthesis
VRLAFLVGRLAIGGAELATIDLAQGLARRGHHVQLFTLFDSPLAADLLPANAQFDYQPLNGPKPAGILRVAWQLLRASVRLRAALRATRAEVLYSALNIANLVAWLASRRRAVRLVWSIHASAVEYSWEDAVATRLCALLSRTVELGVAVSAQVLRHATAHGIRPARFEIIPNGTDTERLRPDLDARRRQRRQWQVEDDSVLVGVVARVAAVKAPERLIAALAIACPLSSRLCAVWVGGGTPGYVAALEQQALAAGLADRLRFVGATLNTQDAYNGIDVFVLCSHSEGFPKAVAEAMAVGLPCIVDARAGAEVVGTAGMVVDAGDAAALAHAILRLAEDPALRAEFGAAARARIESVLSLEATLQATEALVSGKPVHSPGMTGAP